MFNGIWFGYCRRWANALSDGKLPFVKTWHFRPPGSRSLFSLSRLPQKSHTFQVYHIDPDGEAANYGKQIM